MNYLGTQFPLKSPSVTTALNYEQCLHPDGFVLLNVVSSGKFHINLCED